MSHFTMGFGESGPDFGMDFERLADETVRGTRFAFAKREIPDHPNGFNVYAFGFGLEDGMFKDWYYLVADTKQRVVDNLRSGAEFRDFRTGEPYHIVADEGGPIVKDVRETRDPFVKEMQRELGIGGL